MELQDNPAAGFKKKITLQNILPLLAKVQIQNCACTKCKYINSTDNNFCTNCGQPLKEEGTTTLYHLRNKHRSELLKKCEYTVQVARTILYFLSAVFFTGIAFLFGTLDNRFMLAFLFIILSALFLLLARWSISNSFTALITAFIIVLTFSTITVFDEFGNAFTTVGGLYSITISAVLIYFLLRSIQAAYKINLIKEETEIH